MKTINFVFMVVLLILSGCSSSNNEAPFVGGGQTQIHPSDWISLHGAEANADLRSCQGCHGFDFKGGGNAVSCFNCHSSGPPFVGAHPESWNSDPLNSHQLNFQMALSDQTPWTTCAVAACHGAKLQGGAAGPTCQNAIDCHTAGTDGWPPAPANHATFTPVSNGNHGLAAKGKTDPTQSMGNYCLLCHGQPNNVFDGGFISDPAIIANTFGNCSFCHPDATAHPTDWVSTRAGASVYHNDGSLTDGIISDSCALCHTTTGTSPASPFPGAPTCFADSSNGLGCHPSGPGVAPHAVPYTDPSLHGPAAKADLVYCQGCHADTGTASNFGVAGSNPRFDVPKPGMASGCETCHPVGAAHPTGTDLWTFNYDGVDATRRTHFASGNVATACVLCHDVNGSSNGGTAPLCSSCHATTSPFTLNCSACHETPPATGSPNLTGATLVNHAVGTDVSMISNHEDCSICHGASESGSSGILAAKSGTTAYTIFSGTGQGGNHLDGLIEVNTDVGYQDASAPVAQQFGCSLACHPNDTKHQLPNSSDLPTSYGAYTAGTVSCTDCHGYPPDGISAAPGALSAVNHLRVDGAGNNILQANHGDCMTCHGTHEASPGSGTFESVAGAYDPAVNHYNGKINMNSQTGYDYATFGCANTGGCHLNDPQHQLSDSGLGEETGAYGAGSCDFCHGYPPDGTRDTQGAPVGTVRVDHTAFADGGALLLSKHLECQTCHGTKETTPGSGTQDPRGDYVEGTHHRDGKIQMNLDALYQDETAPIPSERFGCNAACHPNGTGYVLPNGSNLPVQLLALGISGACDTCHGNPPTDSTSGGPTGLDNSVGTGSATAGKHGLHANTNGYDCDTCHTGTANSGQMPNSGIINIGFNIALGTTTDTSGSYDGRSIGGGYNAAAGTTVTTGDALTCDLIYCHGTASPQWSDTGTAVCGSCHGDTSGMPSTTPGDGDLSGANSGFKVGKHSQHVPVSVSTTGTECGLCHNGAGAGTVQHVDGTNDIIFDLTQAGSSALYNAGSSTCSSLACHGDAVWDTASTGGCNFCHGYPPTSSADPANNKHVGITPVNHDKFSTGGSAVTGNHSECNTCHGYSQSNGATLNAANGGDDYQLSFHQDGNIEMNGWATVSGQDTQYQQGNFGCDLACHNPSNDPAHQLSDSGLTVQLHRYGSGDCTSCHTGTGSGALGVGPDSTHSETFTLRSCEDCHTGHNAGDVVIPNNSVVGINYSANGETGISLSDPVGTATTEAEICWNCHNSGFADWRNGGDYNNSTTGYTVSSRNWTTASFKPPGNILPNRPVASIHSANATATNSSVTNNIVAGAVTVTSLEAAGDIRCSYCHDVHDLNTLASDNSSGAPYLRGTWLSNPYPVDRPPQVGDSYGTDNQWNPGSPTTRSHNTSLPRLFSNSAASKMPGGFFIDQNSNYPTNAYIDNTTRANELTNTAGLCVVCHGSNVDTMDYYDNVTSSMWRTGNGHSNSTLGGSGGGASDLFDARRGSSSRRMYMAAQSGLAVSDFGQGTFEGSGPFRTQIRDGGKPGRGNSNPPPSGNGWYGGTIGGNLKDGDYSNWYAAGSIGSSPGSTNVSGRAHDFSCSKCHSPHASGLPALLITNCLDFNQGTYVNTVGNDDVGPGATLTTYASRAMVNCHRKESSNTGWNNLNIQQ